MNKSYFLKILIKKIKSILKPIYRILFKTKNLIWDSRLKKSLNVRELGKPIFKIHDFGSVTRMRGNTFEVKKPGTLEWIKGFYSDYK